MFVSWILLLRSSFFSIYVTYPGVNCAHLKPSGSPALSTVVHSPTTNSLPTSTSASSLSAHVPSGPAHTPAASVPAPAPSVPAPAYSSIVHSLPEPVTSVPAPAHVSSVPAPAPQSDASQSYAPANAPSISEVASHNRAAAGSVVQPLVRRRSAWKISDIKDSAEAVKSPDSSLTAGKPSEDPASGGNTPSKLVDSVPTHDQTPATHGKLVP